MKSEMLYSFKQYDGVVYRNRLSELLYEESNKDPYGRDDRQMPNEVMSRQIDKLCMVNDFLMQKLMEAKIISGSDVKDLILSLVTNVSDEQSFKIERE